MARLRDDESVEREDRSTSIPASHAPRTDASASPSPSVNSESEKENRSSNRPKATNMGPPSRPIPQARYFGAQSNKRRRTGDGPTDTDSFADSTDETMGGIEDSGPNDDPVYDPGQDTEERQQIRKRLRDHARDVKDLGASEWLQAGSDGLQKSIVKQNRIYRQVKQTSDATIDSRSLARTAELAAKKTKNAATGDSSQRVDLDDFIGKCIIFMRNGDDMQTGLGHPSTQQASSTQRRRRRTQLDMDDDEDGNANDGDAHNWAWLGSKACYPVNKRPCVPGFLLGPLSVQKRARAVTQRRARQQRVDPEQAIKPRELDAAAFKEQETSGVTHMCKSIFHRLNALYSEVVDAEENDACDADELEAIAERNGILDNGGVSLFHFAINPRSFGQTVENLFYVSFLIKDGLAAMDFDSDGMPALIPKEGSNDDGTTEAEATARNSKKFQAAIGIDFDDWKQLIEAFNIEKPLIEHRQDETTSNEVGASGWYGS